MSEGQTMEDIVKLTKERIEKMSPQDRLDYYSSILETLGIIIDSALAWRALFQNVKRARDLDQLQLSQFFKQLTDIALTMNSENMNVFGKLAPKLPEEQPNPEDVLMSVNGEGDTRKYT